MYAYGDLLTKNLIRMSKRCELQKEYYQSNGNYKGNGKYCDKYVSWLEEQILALRVPDVVGQSEQLKAYTIWLNDKVRDEEELDDLISDYFRSL